MPTPAPPSPLPAGPLAVRWLSYDVARARAGSRAWACVEFENAGAVSWRTRGTAGIHLSYHWLDLLGNPIVWAGVFVALPRPVAPGERLRCELPVRAPMPPGRYRLAFDLVDEGRFWFAELGNSRLELELDVAPRLSRRALAVRLCEGPPELVAATQSALAAQEEPVEDRGEATAFLAAGCRPAPDWSRRILDAHAEGFAAVAGSIELRGGGLALRRVAPELRQWRPGFGRAPAWSHPLLCPSLVEELREQAPWADAVAGLPALDQSRLDEPWLCDGRIRVAVDARALRRDGRRLA